MKDPQKSKQTTWRHKVFIAIAVGMAVVMQLAVVLLLLTMIPTIVSWFTQSQNNKDRTFTIGAMNLAGAAPFILELWRNSGDITVFFMLIQWPIMYVVAYGGAAIGIAVDWITVSVVSSILLQRARKRLTWIEDKQKEMVEIWGSEVAQDLNLTEEGLPIGQPKASR